MSTLSTENQSTDTQHTEVIQTTWIYFTVQQFAKRHPAFNTGGLRALIFNENSNGLAKSGAIVRIGRKVLIDEAKFFAWVESQNQGVAK
ncbi:MAG: hypothetical protein Q8N35_06170 [Methylococcaceae bacterium]|nr:hypothetical protein [Methylococcaceae bacterium]MDZ4219070.1 hypothetical protein [Methylobacter sp.]MDP2394117.1 hypothetical protein [Methylococcaceae bacterium]MDP3019154.1 hypothetical protein [Methylococcaceae bacterium]MDP3388693.1 hypothetical protein [Methylococcaceae bacterium]